MSSALKSWLSDNHNDLQFGLEEFTDGEQKLEVHVAPEASIDHDVAAMAEAEIKQQEIERDCDAVLEAQTAMEAYHELLTQGMENGGISAESAAFMQIGMERFEMMLGGEPIVPALEAFGGSASKQMSTQSTASGIKEKLARVWEITKRILTAFANMVKDVVTKATYAAERLEKRAGEVAKKAGEMSSYTKSKDTIEISGGGDKVFLEGKYVGDDVATIAGSFNTVASGLPQGIVKYISDVASAISVMDPTKDIGASSLNPMFKLEVVWDSFRAMPVSSDKRFPDGTVVRRSKTLPGNVAVYLSAPANTDADKELAHLQSKLKLTLLPVPGLSSPPEKHEVKVADIGKLRARAQQIQKAAANVVNYKKDYAALENAVKQATAAGDKLKERAANAEMNNQTEVMVNTALKGMTVIQKMSGSVNGVLTHTVKSLNAQLAIVEREMAAYTTTAVAKAD